MRLETLWRTLRPKRIYKADFPGKWAPRIYLGRRGAIIKGKAWEPYDKKKAREWGWRAFFLSFLWLMFINWDKWSAAGESIGGLAMWCLGYAVIAGFLIWLVARFFKVRRYFLLVCYDGWICTKRRGFKWFGLRRWIWIAPRDRLEVGETPHPAAAYEERLERNFRLKNREDTKPFPSEYREAAGVVLRWGVRGEYNVPVAWFEKGLLENADEVRLLAAAIERIVTEVHNLPDDAKYVPPPLWHVVFGWPVRRLWAALKYIGARITRGRVGKRQETVEAVADGNTSKSLAELRAPPPPPKRSRSSGA